MEFYSFEKMVLAIFVVTVTWIGCLASIKWIWTPVRRRFGYTVEKREPISKDNKKLVNADASVSSARVWKYDVFLSFRGPDTRKGITSDLYDRLHNRGIKTFMDAPDLKKGDNISPTLLKTIEESRFAIVVLSENYASSTWCLEELAKICQCMEDNNRILPLFYNVEPTDVRYLKGSFEDAFTEHKKSGRYKSKKLQQWRGALNEVASFSGWNLLSYETERQLVEAIVESVCSEVGPIQINTRGFEKFEATRQAMDEVMKALKDDKVTVVGVYGMGGVGKTTMVKFVGDQVQQDGIFHPVIMATVSQRPDVKNIQGTLADLLHIKLKDETVDGRAVRLRNEIMRKNKMLIILDDIWVRMDLSTIGIPSYNELQNRNSKVLLTTRNLHVCESMDSKPNIVLNVLSEQDSWNFFEKITQISFEMPSVFYDVARNVARGCAGLPIALEAIAKALRDKQLNEWNEAVRRLKASQTAKPDDLGVFNCVKFSYDCLRSDDAKSLLLLCCLFPQDYDIHIEDLLTYGIGKGLFQNCNTLKDARVIAHSEIRYLKSSSLLLGTKHDGRVRMHDVIRQMAILISFSEDGQRVLVNAGCELRNWPKINAHTGYSAISLMVNYIRKLPEELVFPKLQILLLQHNPDVNAIPDSFFESLNELRVLDLSKTSISSLPPSFCLLNNLHTLYLNSCKNFFDMSVLGKLQKLEILSLRECCPREVPEEIGHLTKLRMLDITESRIVKIASKGISCLRELEELYMQCSFGDWGSKVEEAEETNVHFDELTGLPFLTTLKVGISDAKFLPTTVGVNPNWEHFDICISRDSKVRESTRMPRLSHNHSRTLTLSTTIHTLPSWFIDVVTEKAEKLQYMNCKKLKNILVEYENGRLQELKYLIVYGFHENLKELMNAEKWDSDKPVFKKLEELHVCEVANIKMLCVGVLPPGSLCKLTLLDVRRCHNLVNALVQSTLLERLQYLEKLCCAHMDGLEYVFGSGKTIFEKLQEMRLCYLPKLIKIWNGHAPHEIFHNLKLLVVSGCKTLKCLFTYDVAQCLFQLEDLWVYCCFSLDSIVEESEVSENRNVIVPQSKNFFLNIFKSEASKVTENRKIIFPKLKNLVLENLPHLRRLLSNGSGSAISLDIEFPSLEHFHNLDCPQFLPSASNFFSQKEVQVNDFQHYTFLKKRMWGSIEIESTISGDGESTISGSGDGESTISGDGRWKYDVFLSFRGVDTRKGIAFELYDELQTRRGIKTFLDDRDLIVGDVISPTLLTAIKESRLAIIILSPNYASSTWCLEELRNICECMKDNNRILPLFYNVHPYTVLYQKRSFGDAFAKHERYRPEKVQQWREALKLVANFSGWDTQNYRTERELVENIVEAVHSKVQPIEMNREEF